VPGAGNISLAGAGLLWHFASVENRAAFEADFARPMPRQFRRPVVLGVRRGDIVAGDPPQLE